MSPDMPPSVVEMLNKFELAFEITMNATANLRQIRPAKLSRVTADSKEPIYTWVHPDMVGNKWPSLDEACELLLNEPPRTGPHNAWDDIQRAKLLFFWLRSRGALEIEAAA